MVDTSRYKYILTGQKFNEWTIGEAAEDPAGLKRSMWWGTCSCGTRRLLESNRLRMGRAFSCGCKKSELISRKKATHGQCRRGKKTIEYTMWMNAKRRATKMGWEFNLRLEDIVIPAHCPLLGIPLEKSDRTYWHPASPSLDRIDPNRGYTKDNVQIVSWRANKIKSDATLEELESIVASMRKLAKY